MAPPSPLPAIPAVTRGVLAAAIPGEMNASLLFDRGADHWRLGTSADGRERPEAGPIQPFLERVRRLLQGAPGATTVLLNNVLARQQRLVDHLGGRTESLTTTARLVSGLGMAHPTENGFVWDRTLGLPYLPGSSIKGALRAWARDWAEMDAREVDYLFGDTEEVGVGAIIVHDAFPLQVPALDLEVMAVHHPAYYRAGGGVAAPAPVDSENPNIIVFLTVAAGTPLRFAVSPRVRPANSADLDQALTLLRAALATIGIGAKTATGYGRFS